MRKVVIGMALLVVVRARCTSAPSDAVRGVLCTGDPTAGTLPVDDVIGKLWTKR